VAAYRTTSPDAQRWRVAPSIATVLPPSRWGVIRSRVAPSSGTPSGDVHRNRGSFPEPRLKTTPSTATSQDIPGHFWDAPEQFLLDAGKEGELLIARVRVGLTLALLLVPVANLLWAAPEEREQHVAGFFVTLAACLLSLGVYVMVVRDRRQRWLPMATSFFDISLITVAQLIYAFVQDPHVVVNSKITFDTYFIALAATCLRYDKRVALLAGLMAMLQFTGTILFVTSNFPLDTVGGFSPYGRFQWSDQFSRLVLLGTATALNVYIVHGIQKQRKLSTADPLTGTFNRRFFDGYLRNELARAARYGSALAIAMIDVDHFKQFNDRFGHAAGDVALRHVARALELAVRRSDLVARYGGEEFVVILRESTAEQAIERMQLIRESIAREPMLDEEAWSPPAAARVTVSIGVATWPTDGRNAMDLLAEADRRLFAAKDAGRNRVIGPPAVTTPAIAS
jgi:diguanylate cyclase (GGDEF)-like protein